MNKRDRTRKAPKTQELDFGNTPGSHQDAVEEAANKKKGGKVRFDPVRRIWLVIRDKRPRGMSDEDDAWGFKA